MKLPIIRTFALFALMAAATAFAAEPWKETLQKQLPLLGHRNWIVIADSAYPLQVSPGIETIYADADQLTVVNEVLAALAKTRHVQPAIFTDKELKYVAETNAPGISGYRKALAELLKNQPVQVLPHEQIIGQLDEAGRTFKVLIVKTTMTKPYTSVFIQLQCGYWDAASEKQLREAMPAQK